MGTWSYDAFGNDIACDWASDFALNPSLDKVRDALDKVVALQNDYLNSNIACEALVACEIVARLHGNFGISNGYSYEIDEWTKTVDQQPNSALDDLAIAAIDRILGPTSELAKLWHESGEDVNWHDSMNNLRKRIRSQGGDT
jgi:hypothetical protein